MVKFPSRKGWAHHLIVYSVPFPNRAFIKYHYALMLLITIIHAVSYQKTPSAIGSIPLLRWNPKDLFCAGFCVCSLVFYMPFFIFSFFFYLIEFKSLQAWIEGGSCLNWYRKAQVLIGSFCTMQQPQHYKRWYLGHLLICESGNKEAKGSRSIRTILQDVVIDFLCWVFALTGGRQ